MADTINQEFVVNAGGGWSFLARIKNHSGSDVTQSSITSITRTITDTVTGTAVTDTITVSTAVYDTLQSNSNVWDQSYNFKDDVAADKIALRHRYTLQYTFDMGSGADIKTKEVDVIGD